jgi:bifunctional DNase/RNase
MEPGRRSAMIEVTIAGIQISLMSQHRVVLLKEVGSDRYLPIWIGPCEAEAINIELQNIQVARPLTHDLLRNAIDTLGGTVERVVVSDLRDDTFFARVFISANGREIEIDSRPSDAIALAVRTKSPIYVADEVMVEAGIIPERDLMTVEEDGGAASALDDFLSNLDIDDLPIQ